MPIYVHGFRELSAAFAKVGGDTNREFRASERRIAEPIRRDTETLAHDRIRRMPASPLWAKMRTGVTRKLVYVAPRQRGARRQGDFRRRRPNLADLLMTRAMEPALEKNAANVEREIAALLDRVARDFNHGGP